ncbi:Zinc uptake regulation protein ZUR [Liberibacter crescens BT-1]|uniref:Zinc uptake regulation protein ZUR n=1 Tax=Liberibacter crescens (strain BT-1) TaxID=1215343 RepID=L0EWD0_LIBCB|nr:transcriptional repressor [Liberibacter crescens]AGA65267.1 Zinc uptake regulation protein ZUR [Liberibacter crescens BT-1]AMC13203.1 Fur family transcriptional regulator [Liberibacter crescens]
MKNSLTRNQSLVYKTLRSSEKPLTAYNILDILRDYGFRAPLQVYRALDKLTEYGFIHRLETINAFIACAHEKIKHNNNKIIVFTICETCNHVDELQDYELDKLLIAKVQEKNFYFSKATIEILGNCSKCFKNIN